MCSAVIAFGQINEDSGGDIRVYSEIAITCCATSSCAVIGGRELVADMTGHGAQIGVTSKSDPYLHKLSASPISDRGGPYLERSCQ